MNSARRKKEKQAVGAYVRDRLRRECSERGVATKIAKATGFTSATLTNVQKGERGIGDDFARAMGAYWGMELHELETEALRWASEHLPLLEEADAYPRRALAARLAREARVHEDAVLQVLAESVNPIDADQPTLWWADRIRQREVDILREIAQRSERHPMIERSPLLLPVKIKS